jgi:hypothetical protein
MSGIKAPIQDMLAKLGTLTVPNGHSQVVPLQAFIWNNQLNHEKKGELYNYAKPIAYLEIINSVEYLEIGGGYASADLGFRVHLVHEMYHDGNNMDMNLAVFDLRDQMVNLLTHYEPTGCSMLQRVMEDQDYDHDNLYHYVIGFVCSFIDSRGSDDERLTFITKQPPTDATVTGTEQVPTLAAYVADTSYFNVPQS